MTHAHTPLLTAGQVEVFERDGLLALRGFYDMERDLEPIQRAIHRLIGVMIMKHGLPIKHPPFRPETFDAGFMELIARDRAIGAVIYDAVKQIPAFARLTADPRHEALMQQLRDTQLPGVEASGSGIRIDIPGEDRFRSPWHQEYPSHLRSLDGIVFWSPLVPIAEENGPVEFCVGSHKDGPVPLHRGAPKHAAATAGAYTLKLADEAERLARYEHVAPLSVPGDLILVDFLTLHASGLNTSDRPRWSMQFRLFNFLEPTGISHDWCGSYHAGVDFATVHPELVADAPRERVLP
jgi:hypothetical protein